MKHIKFEENISADVSYKRDKAPKKEYVQKAPETENDEYDIPETKKWHQEIPEEPIDAKPLSGEEIAALKREATAFLHGESLANETKMSKIGSSDQKWARSLLMKGAMADRVAAATVLIQDSPIHNVSTLQNLVAMVKPSKKKDSLTAIETLTELFVFDLLIPDGKLRPFEARPVSALDKMCSGNKDHRKKILMIWMFEDKLKETYAEFIKCLNNFAHDTIEAHKEKAVSAMAKLLMHNPEQEKVLLSSIVNKLGDPSQKVASKVIYQLCQVLYNHPNMKAVVLGEIEKMLFRPNISAKAQYYGVCFLNQFYLSKDDSKIAENLVRVYFSFFRACIKKGEVDSRLMGGILTGVRRCQPFLSEGACQALQAQAHPLHRLVHLAGYTVALQALALLQQMGPTDRYYCALYKKLSHPETLTTTLPAMLLGLVYRSIKADENEPRILAFLKRLLQLAAMSDAGRAAATLLVVARLARRHRLPLGRDVEQIKEEPTIDITESNAPETNGEIDNTSNKADDSNSTSENSKKSKKKKNKMNGETKSEEVKVDVKENVDNLKKKLDWWIGDKLDLLNDEDDEEVYHDIPLEEDEQYHKRQLHNLLRKKKESSGVSWLHTAQTPAPQLPPEDEEDGDDDDGHNKDKDKGQEYSKKDLSKAKEFEILIKKSKNMEKVVKEYSPLNRNPAFCGAEHSVVTELLLLKNHYHPSVRLFSEKLLQGSVIQYNGDPLKDFSIARFLDRFAFKNPKKDPSQRSGDPDEPAPEAAAPKNLVRGSHPKFAVRKNYTASGIKTLPVNSNAYLNEDEAHIPVDERFLYDYFQTRRQAKGDESDAESDAGSVDSVEFESYLDSISGKPKKAADESEEESQDEMDYMKEMVAHSKLDKKSRKAKGEEEGEGEDEESEEEEEVSDDGGSLPSDMDEDEADLGDDDDDLDGDDSDLVFSGEDDAEEAMLEGKVKKGKKLTKKSSKDDSDLDFSEDERDMVTPAKNKKKGKKGVESMFASAEEFATLLEETGTSKKQGTSQAVSTSDNANVRQLNWEESRDHWVRGKGKFENRAAKKGGKFDKGGKGKFDKGGKKFEKSGKSRKVGQGNRKRQGFAGAGNSAKKRKSN